MLPLQLIEGLLGRGEMEERAELVGISGGNAALARGLDARTIGSKNRLACNIRHYVWLWKTAVLLQGR